MSQQQYRMLVQSIKANQFCKNQRKRYNIATSNPLGRFIEPQLASRQAFAVVNCFHNMRLNETPEQLSKKQLAVDSLMNNRDSEQLINSYVRS